MKIKARVRMAEHKRSTSELNRHPKDDSPHRRVQAFQLQLGGDADSPAGLVNLSRLPEDLDLVELDLAPGDWVQLEITPMRSLTPKKARDATAKLARKKK